MITLDTNLIYQTKHYILNTKRKNLNAYESIENYPQAHAANGTPESQSINSEDLDYKEVIKALQLENPDNRLQVLNLLDHSDLVQLTTLLEKEQMLLGLNFFTKKKLLKFISQMPKEKLIEMLQQFYTKDEILEFLPIKELMQFLDNAKIQGKDLYKVLQSLPQHTLAQIYESIYGTPADKMSSKEIVDQLKGLKQETLMEGVKALSYKEMLNFINKLTKLDDELFKSFSTQSLFEPIAKWQKSTIIDSMTVIEPDKLVKLLGELPNNLLAQVATLIDPEKLSDALQKYHTDILASLVA